VAGFLANPLGCVFGTGDGTIVDFFTDITDEAITGVMSGAITPLAAEAIYAFSGLAWLEKLFGLVCEMLGIIDKIIDIVEGLAEGISDVFEALNPFSVSAANVTLAAASP
jgi:hypothetical protein